MGVFNFGKKKTQEPAPACSCKASVAATKHEGCGCGAPSAEAAEHHGAVDVRDGVQHIQVLGTGCKSCHAMYENTKKAVAAAGLDIEVDYVTDLEKITAYGIMTMPGLVLNGTVVSAGKVLKPAEIEKLLHQLGV